MEINDVSAGCPKSNITGIADLPLAIILNRPIDAAAFATCALAHPHRRANHFA
jgi:hypothetical protein